MIKVFTNGCFDVLHVGHIELLKFAKSLGDILIVGINSDTSVRNLKGQTRPIHKEQDRKIILENLKSVDKVIIFEEDTPLRLIQEQRPDIIVKGGDYTAEDVVGNELAKVIIFNYIDGYSTSKIIEGIGNR